MAKNRIVAYLILWLVWGMDSSFLRPEISEVYSSQIGQMEKPAGSNWGHPVQDYLAATSVHAPAAWCAAFVKWCLDSAGIKTPITAYSPSAQNKNNLIYYKTHELKELKSGDVFTIYYVSMGRIAHTGFVNRKINSTIVETIEGNSNDGGSREGVGVFKRKRPMHTLYSISRWP